MAENTRDRAIRIYEGDRNIGEFVDAITEHVVAAVRNMETWRVIDGKVVRVDYGPPPARALHSGSADVNIPAGESEIRFDAPEPSGHPSWDDFRSAFTNRLADDTPSVLADIAVTVCNAFDNAHCAAPPKRPTREQIEDAVAAGHAAGWNKGGIDASDEVVDRIEALLDGKDGG